jgi:hypothetical protein
LRYTLSVTGRFRGLRRFSVPMLLTGPPLAPETQALIEGMAKEFNLPSRLSEVREPLTLLIDIHDLDRYGRLFAMKVLSGLFDSEPDQAPRWLPIGLEPDPTTDALLIKWDSVSLDPDAAPAPSPDPPAPPSTPPQDRQQLL